MRITAKIIDSALSKRKAALLAVEPGSAYRDVLRDDDLRGLALVINRKNASWVFSYRPTGVEQVEKEPGVFVTARPGTRHVKLGDASTLSPDDARRAAAEVKLAVVAKQDPAQERRAEVKKRAAATKRATCDALLPMYEQHLSSVTSRKTRRKLGERHIESEMVNLKAMFASSGLGIGSLQPSEITHDHVTDIPSKAKGSTAARHWHGALNRFLQWCFSQKRVASVVTRDIPLPPAPPSRSRWLTADEIGKAWAATSALDPAYAAFMRWLMVIPCRREEAAEMRWSAVDMKGAVWSQAAADVKNAEPHRFHLHPMAIEVLEQRLEAARQPGEKRDAALKRLVAEQALVFPSPKSGTPILAYSSIMRQLHNASGTSEWSMHDLRRSFASHLGEAGQDVGIVDQVLNHKASSTKTGVMAVYQRAQRWPMQVEAMKVWGNMLAAFTGWMASASEGTNVIEMKKNGA
jgi:integrase